MRPWNLLLSFKGHINRVQYLIGMLILLGITILFALGKGYVTTASPDIIKLIAVIVTIFFIMIFITGYLALNIKRLRDIGWNQWLILLFFIPLIMQIMQILCLVIPGKEKGSLV